MIDDLFDRAELLFPKNRTEIFADGNDDYA